MNANSVSTLMPPQEGAYDALRALNSVKVLYINADNSSSETTLFKTL
jgi:hypothetical protein